MESTGRESARGGAAVMAQGGGAAPWLTACQVFDEMPKRNKRGKVTIIHMQGHLIQTWFKSNTILI
jgi:hypothetical protein